MQDSETIIIELKSEGEEIDFLDKYSEFIQEKVRDDEYIYLRWDAIQGEEIVRAKETALKFLTDNEFVERVAYAYTDDELNDYFRLFSVGEEGSLFNKMRKVIGIKTKNKPILEDKYTFSDIESKERFGNVFKEIEKISPPEHFRKYDDFKLDFWDHFGVFTKEGQPSRYDFDE